MEVTFPVQVKDFSSNAFFFEAHGQFHCGAFKALVFRGFDHGFIQYGGDQATVQDIFPALEVFGERGVAQSFLGFLVVGKRQF